MRHDCGASILVPPDGMTALGAYVLEVELPEQALDLANGNVSERWAHAALPGTWKYVTSGAAVMAGAGACSR